MADVEQEFEAAAQYVGAAAAGGTLSDAQLLRFYGLYKQATAGPCDAPKPSFFDRRGRAKWQAWKDAAALSMEEAQRQYVQLLSEALPGWAGASAAGSSGAAKRGGGGGPVQSRMADAAEDSEGPDAAPPLLQAARAGDAGAAAAALQAGADPDQRGNDGETALHWAADRGHIAVLQLLLQHGADVNAADSDGLTPLHYAALAEQRGAAEQLAAAPGMRLGQRNGDGETPADLAPEGWAFLQGCRSGGEEA
ncbi:hypothetical protein ABPG75_012974 [Micractinium tetrahymenae]